MNVETCLKKRNIRPNQQQLIEYLRTQSQYMCDIEITHEYINAVFNKCNNGFVYCKDKLPMAFCIWEVDEHFGPSGLFKELYIYLICGKQLNYTLIEKIIDDVVHLCKKTNIQYIRLEPMNNALEDYYIQYGFKLTYGVGNSKLLELDVNNLEN
jgi:hypothetical protein